MAAERQRKEREEKEWKYTIYMVGFPSDARHSNDRRTLFHVSKIISHLVLEARVLPFSIFSGEVTARSQEADIATNADDEHVTTLEKQTRNIAGANHPSIAGVATSIETPGEGTLSSKLTEEDLEDAVSVASTDSDPFWPASIEKEARALLDFIHSITSNREDAHRSSIVLAGYGFGGFVVKQAIILAHTIPKYYDIAYNVIRLVFFSTPHRVDDKRGWEGILLDMIKAPEARFPGKLSQILSVFVSSVSQLSHVFHKFAAKYSIVNFIEECGISMDEAVVGKLGMFDNDFEDVVVCEQKNFNTIMLCDIDRLEELEPLRTHFGPGEPCNHDAFFHLGHAVQAEIKETYFEALQVLSKSHYILHQAIELERYEDFIMLKDIYGSLLRGIASKSVRDSGAIQVIGPARSGKSALLKVIVQEIRQKSSVIVLNSSFTTLEREETPTLYGLLASFLHQTISQRPSLFYAISNMVAELLHRDSWTEKSLRTVFTALLHACEGMDLLILIHDYEQWPVEIRSWWTKDLRHLLQSSGTRFTFITSSRSRIENLASQKAHEIDLERNYAKLRRKFVRARLSSLLDRDYSSIILRQSPQADLRSIIIEKADAFKGSFRGIDAYLTLLCQSFPLTTAGAIEGHIEASSGTEERLYNHEISALRVKHVDISFWIASAISWMMLSARPLRLEELAAAAAINADDDTLGDIQEKISMDMAQDLKRHLGPIVAVENNHGCIASAAARAILAATPSKNLDLQDDYKLTRLCLHYLRLVLTEEHQETDIKVELKKPEATLEAMQQHRWGKCLSYVSWKHQSHNHYEPALEFLDYACRFWPTHFLRIKNPDSSLKKEVINFLQASHGQKWFQLYLICHGQSSDTFGKDEEVEKTTVGMLECEPTENGKQPDAENETQPHLASSYETGATWRQLAVRMACYLGLTPIIPELLGSDMLSISFDIVNMHRGSSERIVTIFNNATPYYLNCAISNDDADLAKKLFELRQPKTAKYYPLHKAALGDSLNTFKILFGLLDDPTETNDDGRTPLHMAAAGGSSSIIQLILSNSIVKSGLRSTEDLSTLDKGDNKQQTPLIIAASMGHVEATKLLLQYSADVSIQDDTGKTALHYAVLTCPAAVEDLVSQNSAHIRDNDDCTALHIAARSGNARTTVAIVVALRQGSRFGEVVNSRDKANKTPLQYAAEYGYRAIVEEFLRYQEEVEEGNLRLAAQLSASCGQLSTVRSLISRTDVNTRSQLLVEASDAGQLLIVQYLLREKRISPDSEGQGLRPLCQASAKGHIEVVRALLRSRASVGIADEQRKTPLHHAAENGMYTVAKTLLFEDANVNAPDMNRETPLHSAAKSGNTSVIKLLLESKANVEACSRTKETPLHLAVTYPEAVNTLLKAGAEPNAVDSLKQTPLHMAARDKCLQSVQYLLQNKADVHARDDNGRLPLYYAIKEDDLSMVRELYQDHDDLKTNLSWAMDNSAVTVLDYLLQLGHKTKDEFDNVGVELLHVAAANESVEVLDVLLRSGVDVNVQFQGSSVLHSATVNGHVANIRKLLEYKATVDTIDDNGQTPLHLAAEANQTGVVEVLLQAGSDINALDEDSQTPVFIAAYHGSVESLKMLLQHKPDISITRDDGWAPLHAGADNLEVTRLLVGAGANPNMPKQDQWTPFHLAISWGDQFIAEYLLQHGGDPMLITEDSYTTLHLAVRANLREMAEALLESGAKDYINERAGIEKHTTLHIALDRPWVDPEMTRLLIEHGADVDLRTSKGLSTLELAVNACNPEILNLLLSRKITSRKDPDWKLDDLIPAYWRVITLHGQDIAEDETTPSTQYHNIIRTLVEKQKTLLNEESAEGGLNALEVCLSKRSKRRKEESLAILLVEQGINPLSRRHSHCESALQIGILSRELVKDDFLNLCVSKIPENATDAAALGLGFRELRIATELNQPNMWCKLEPLRDQVGNNTDTDGWSIDHFVHQASGRIPARVKVLPSISSKTPQGMVFPSWWATNDQILGERFKIVDDGLGILFSLSRTNRVNLRADFPFPPRSIDPKNGDIQYFEVKILPAENIVEDFNHESETTPLPIIAIGFCGEFADMTNAMLGWNVWTVGYHGDNGMIFNNQDTLHGDHDTGRKFGQGNTVGCGIDYSNEEYFFTCDGEVVARHKDKVIFRKLYPAISHLDGSCKAEVSFDESKFVWQWPKRQLTRVSTRPLK